MTHEFLSTWRDFQPSGPPFVLPGDWEVLRSDRACTSTIVTHLDEYISAPAFGEATDRALHLGLCPLPFIGNPTKASVFILMLNPGLHLSDFFAEQQPEFRNARWANLRGESDFMGLDPRFAWTSGFTYWHGKLASVVRGVASRARLEYRNALQHVASSLCVLELVPYHSSSFGLSDRIVSKMASARLARKFVHDVLVPKARDGTALIVVTRQAKGWGLGPDCGAIIYQNSETRAAHLGDTSRGGRRILDFLTPPVT